jgi:hypothetical protein
MLDEIHPVLVIIDSLRAFEPESEKDPTAAANLLKRLRGLAYIQKTAFLLLHHLKKPGEFGLSSLENTPPLEWLQQACGPRAFVNQSDFRLGIDCSRGKMKEVASLVICGYRRVRGEFGPIYLVRSFDENGDPVGYNRISGVELPREQQLTFDKLPASFKFKEAKQIYGRGGQATSDFLKKCVRLELLQKKENGVYYKVSHTQPLKADQES